MPAIMAHIMAQLPTVDEAQLPTVDEVREKAFNLDAVVNALETMGIKVGSAKDRKALLVLLLEALPGREAQLPIVDKAQLPTVDEVRNRAFKDGAVVNALETMGIKVGSARDRKALLVLLLEALPGRSNAYYSLAYDPNIYVIPGLDYKSVRECQLKREPYDKNPDQDAWYLDESASFPRADFTNLTVKAIPRPDGQRVRWGTHTFSVEEWKQHLERLQRTYPNITHSTRVEGPLKESNYYETKSHRVSRTSSPKNIEHCFGKCKRPSWQAPEIWQTADLSGPIKTLLALFRVDMWGNVICLSKSAGGRASDGALCFFDVDHIFPFARGGRSVPENFEAVQCYANRCVKKVNLVQALDPRKMQCGITAAQLLAMVKYCEEVAGKLRRTQENYRRQILEWLTTTPPNGKGFSTFQEDVKRSKDGKVLVEYFVKRSLENSRALAGDSLAPLPAPAPSAAQLNVRVCEGGGAGGRVELWGSSSYCVKDALRDLGFIWDADRSRRCWYRGFEREGDKEQLLEAVQRLAQAYAFQYTLLQ
jgi:hypothetical protein